MRRSLECSVIVEEAPTTLIMIESAAIRRTVPALRRRAAGVIAVSGGNAVANYCETHGP